MELNELLSIDYVGKLGEKETYEDHFKKVAQELFQNYCICKGDKYFQFLELEFYLHTPAHSDVITYPRKTNAGDWFFHMSGVDLCFDSQNMPEEKGTASAQSCFGGILIRSLLTPDNKVVNGPMKCCECLFDQFSALDPKNKAFLYPVITPRKCEVTNISSCPRYFSFKDDATKCENKLNDILVKRFKGSVECTEKEFKDQQLEKKYRFFVEGDYYKNYSANPIKALKASESKPQ